MRELTEETIKRTGVRQKDIDEKGISLSNAIAKLENLMTGKLSE